MVVTVRAAQQTDFKSDVRLIKPLRMSELYNALNRTRSPDQRATEASTSSNGQRLGHTILIVEDNEINQIVAAEMLDEMGYDHEIAENGAVAVEMIADRSFDAVLMDCQMPVMDGYEAARQVTARVKQPGLVTETTTEFEAGVTGRMNPTTRTVSKIRTLADKSEVRESTVYRPWTAARAAPGGGLHVSEQLLVERKPGRGNTVIEKTSVRTPSLDYPYSLGKPVNVSEVICSGQCTPEQ